MSATVDLTIYQMAFWAPEREVSLLRMRPRRRRSILEMLALAEVGAAGGFVTDARVSEADAETGAYPCTYPGCHRGPADPFASAPQLANHRFAAHGIRSTNEESIKRQQRRDRRRAQEKGNAPEYIDRHLIRAQVLKLFPINLPKHTKDGPLDIGDREHVRRRLCYLITSELQRELKRTPAEICIAISEIAATGLVPMGLNKRVLNPIEAFSSGSGSMRLVGARKKR